MNQKEKMFKVLRTKKNVIDKMQNVQGHIVAIVYTKIKITKMFLTEVQ